MSTWKVTLIRTDKVEARNRREAIDKALSEHGHSLGPDNIEARKTTKH